MKYKIGIVCHPTYGGSGVVATELGIALSQSGHEIHFISYNQPFRLDLFSDNIYYHEVNVPDYPLFEYTPYELNLTSKIVDVAIHEKLDLMHVHYAIPHASSAINAKKILESYGINLPIVTTLHGTDITLLGKDKSFKPVIEYAINMSDSVTAVSNSLAQETYQNFKVHKEINVIPNFIDMSLYQQSFDLNLRNKFAAKKEFILTHISNFRKVKRVLDVIKIFELVGCKAPVKLLMIGDGPDRIKAEQLTREMKLENKVKFLGKLKVIEKILSISDIFILPSQTESFGLVALEAMASSNAVISTNSGGICEVNIDGYTGFLSNVSDVIKMSDDILKLINNPAKLNSIKLNAVDHAKSFSIDNVLPKYLMIYNSLCLNQKLN